MNKERDNKKNQATEKSKEEPNTTEKNKIEQPPVPANEPDTIVIKAYPDHRIQVNYEFKGKSPEHQKDIALSIIENTARGLMLEIFTEKSAQDAAGIVMAKITEMQQQAAPVGKIIKPGEFVVPEQKS